MKFIGQYIQSLIARFRNDVYFESVPDGSIDSGKNLGLDASNKLVKATVSGGGGGVTVSDSNTDSAFPVVFHDESNNLHDDTGTFFYNPNEEVLNVGTSTTATIGTSGRAQALTFRAQDNTDTPTGPIFDFHKSRGVGNASQNNDISGQIKFKNRNDASPAEVITFAEILSTIANVTDGDERGKIELKVANDGTLRNGITMTGTDTAEEVDVTIANGTSSTTTIAGDLKVNGNDIKDNDGTTCITFDSSGNTTIQKNLTVGAQPDGDATLIISADTDNGNGEEGDNARLWFKQDGDITEGAIQMSSNVLNIINNISGAGGISFQTGTTNNTGTTDPSTGATERMSISSAGNISFSGPITFTNQTAQGESITTVDAIINNIKAAIRFGRMGTAASSYGGACDIMQEGTVSGGGNTVAGRVYQLLDSSPTSGTPTWRETNASIVTGATGLLAIALGTTPGQGMLLRGAVVIDSSMLPNATPGATLFLRDSFGGRMTTIAPNSTGDIQRIVGHYLVTASTTNHSTIYFNPSQEFIEIG